MQGGAAWQKQLGNYGCQGRVVPAPQKGQWNPGKPMAPCWYFARGLCTKEVGCTFSHRPEEALASALEGDATTPTCWYFEKGVCRSGAACVFKHVGNVPQNPENIKRLRVGLATEEPEDDSIYTAIKVALRCAATFEKEDSLLKLRSRVAKYCRDAIADVDYNKGLEAAVHDYADSFFTKFFQGFGDRPWTPEADLLLIMTEALKELLEKQASEEVGPDEFEELIFSAHDRALDEQRCMPAIWESVQQAVQGPKIRSKVYKACEAGRKATVNNPEVVGSKAFATEWIQCTLNRLKVDGHGYVDGILDEDSAKQLFAIALETGAVPSRCLADDPGPDEGWPQFATTAVENVYNSKSKQQPAQITNRPAGAGPVIPVAPSWRRNGPIRPLPIPEMYENAYDV